MLLVGGEFKSGRALSIVDEMSCNGLLFDTLPLEDGSF
ncbi:hypothetical protein AB988_2721 [Acinetobacter baumannii]|nr:hypothetical protein A1S_3635 [Acinetobacter baumannii ATCC 17978]KMV13306.1 hypothetical protein AB988_2721 [Acinetobacter baumannii]